MDRFLLGRDALCASLEGEGSSFTILNFTDQRFMTATKFTAKMDTLGIEATPEEVDLMIDEIDQDNNGEIDFEGTARCREIS